MNNHEVTFLDRRKENEAIRRILESVLQKWRQEIEESGEDLEKTHILSSDRAAKIEGPPFSGEDLETKEALPETMIITPDKGKEKISVSPSTVKPKAADSTQKPEEPFRRDEFLEETVILKPPKTRNKKNE